VIDQSTFAPFVLVEHDDPPVRNCGGRSRCRYNLVLHDRDMQPVASTFALAGVAGDGCGWNGFAESLAAAEMPAVAELVNFLSDPGTFVLTSHHVDALRQLAGRLAAAYHDPELLAHLLRPAREA
jgi:hypothetical protein